MAASIGLHRAMALTLTSERIDAETARSLGIVHEVVAADVPLPAAQALAARLCEASPLSIRASKDMVLASLGLDFAAAHLAQAERQTTLTMWNSEDAKEGPLSATGWSGSRTRGEPQRPSNRAGRFSVNAWTPSAKSLVPPANAWFARSSASASASVQSRQSRTPCRSNA